MKERRAALVLSVLTVLVTALPSHSRPPEKECPSPAPMPRDAAYLLAIAETDFHSALAIRKARLDLEILEARVLMKQAELQRIEAQRRIRRLAPDRAILAKLEEAMSIHFAWDTPLEDVRKHLRTATAAGPDDPGIPIYVDPAALQ